MENASYAGTACFIPEQCSTGEELDPPREQSAVHGRHTLLEGCEEPGVCVTVKSSKRICGAWSRSDAEVQKM